MTKAKFNHENSPEELQNLLKRGTQLLQRGQNQEAVAVLEKAYALDETNPDAALNLSGAYILTNDRQYLTHKRHSHERWHLPISNELLQAHLTVGIIS